MPSATYGFLGNPKALTIITSGSHTVAAGEYAYVTAQVRNGGAMTFDATTVLDSIDYTVLSSSALTYHVGTNSTGQLAIESAASIVTGNAFSNSTAGQTETASFWVPTGTVIACSGTARVTIQRFNA